MALEDLTGTGKFIDALNPAWPVDDDWVDEGDNHIRGIKNVLRNTFPNVNGAVSVTEEMLNLASPPARRLIGRIDQTAVSPAGFSWGAAVSTDAKLVAMSVDIEELYGAADATMGVMFLQASGAQLADGLHQFVLMENFSGALGPVGRGASGANLVEIGTERADGYGGIVGRIWWAMPIGGGILRGTLNAYRNTPAAQVANVSGVFQVHSGGMRTGGIRFYANSGGATVARCAASIWGHYLP